MQQEIHVGQLLNIGTGGMELRAERLEIRHVDHVAIPAVADQLGQGLLVGSAAGREVCPHGVQWTLATRVRRDHEYRLLGLTLPNQHTTSDLEYSA